MPGGTNDNRYIAPGVPALCVNSLHDIQLGHTVAWLQNCEWIGGCDDYQPWFQLSPFLTHPYLGVSQSFFTFSSAVSQFKSTSPQVKQCQIQTARRPVSHETGISKVIIPASDPMAARCLDRDCLFKSGRDVWLKLSCLDVVTVANIFLELGTKPLKKHMTVSDYKL